MGRAQGAEAKGCSLAVQEFLEAAREGARECLQNGITTVADCTDSAHAAQAMHETGLRGVSHPDVPTLIGDVGLATRSMFRNRSGRPRSETSRTGETISAAAPT